MIKRKTKIALILVLAIHLVAPLAMAPGAAAQDEYHFSLTLCAPTNNPARIAHSGIIGDSLRRFNIDADLTLLEWVSYLNRVFFMPEELIGKTWDEGGIDIAFIGWSLGITPDPTYLYHSDNIPTYNYGSWDNELNDQLIEDMLVEVNDTARNELMVQWMELYLEEVPKAILYYPEEAWAYDPDLNNFEETSQLTPSPSNFWWDDGGGTFKIGQNADPRDFNILIYQSYYDAVAMGGCYESLMTYLTSEDLFSYTETPALATGYDVSADGLEWTYYLREDVYWPTGHKFTSKDVELGWNVEMTPIIGCPSYGGWTSAGLTNDSIEVIDDYTIKVTFPSPYAWAKFLLNGAPMPYDVMEEQGLVPVSDPAKAALWTTHGMDSGEMWTTKDVNGDDFDVYGPFGLGAHRCVEEGTGWDATARTTTLKRWDTTTGLANGTIVPYWGGTDGYNPVDMFETYVCSTISSADAAIAALQDDTIDMIDAQFQFQNKLGLIDPSWGTAITQLALSLQEFSFNMNHPVFGTGVATPNGIDDPENAATYAKYVRQAINYMIPRQAIIDQILAGYGIPGVTYIAPVLAAYDPSMARYNYDPAMAEELLVMAGYEIETTVPETPILLYVTAGVAVAAVIVAIVAIMKLRR